MARTITPQNLLDDLISNIATIKEHLCTNGVCRQSRISGLIAREYERTRVGNRASAVAVACISLTRNDEATALNPSTRHVGREIESHVI